MPKQKLEDASPFFGFTPGTLTVVPILKTVLALPQHIMQLGFGRDACIAMRIGGATYGIMPAEVDALPYLPIGGDIPFWCVFSTPETSEAVADFVQQTRHPLLHASTVDRSGSVLIQNLTSNDLLGLLKRVVGFMPQLLSDNLVRSLYALNAPRDSWVPARVPVTRRNHFCTIANEVTLASLKYEFRADEPLLASTEDQVYIQAILASAEAVQIERQRVETIGQLPLPPAINLILSSPAFLHNLYKTKPRFPGELRVARQMLRALITQDHYFLDGNKVPLDDIRSSQFSAILTGYRSEMEAYTATVAAKASANFAPVLRLSPAVNQIHPQLSQLGVCARADAVTSPNHEFKENKLALRIKRALTAAIPNQFLNFIDTPRNHIKFIGNAPLEWLPVRGLPMMIRYETSRIPSTPGSGLFLMACKSYEIGAPSAAFDEVLIVRSFQEHDPLKIHLETGVESVRKRKREGFSVKLVDVSTVDEFISVVNEYKGAVMIFDGHGHPSSLSEVGAIVLDGTPVDIWKYREKLRVPPIVILSACDTHPIDGSHASVANAFLLLGATTVLGTLLPIYAQKSSVFISRLILRISEYIPLVTQTLKQQLRWTSVVSGLQRMSYVTEQIAVLNKRARSQIDPNQESLIQTRANELISNEDDDWYEKTIKIVANEFKLEETEIVDTLGKWGQLPDTIKYIQLGNPEQILIASD